MSSEIRDCFMVGTPKREAALITTMSNGGLILDHLFIADISFARWPEYARWKLTPWHPKKVARRINYRARRHVANWLLDLSNRVMRTA